MKKVIKNVKVILKKDSKKSETKVVATGKLDYSIFVQ